MTVWKYIIDLDNVGRDDNIDVVMPSGAELLTVARTAPVAQPDLDTTVTMWARVNPNNTRVERRLRIVGTGNPGANGVYLGTTIHFNGSGVFHIFDLGEQA